MKLRGGLFLATALAPVLTSVPASPSAFGWAVPDPYATGLHGPVQLALTDPPTTARPGQPRHPEALIVAEQRAAQVSRVRWDGTVRDLVRGAPGVGGVAMRHGRVAFTVTTTTPRRSGMAQLKVRRRDGSVRTVAHLAAFERRANPDRRRTYGFVDLAPRCADRISGGVLRSDPYRGEVDSNPYALANAPGGGWYVADAGGNDILEVTPQGRVRVVYVARPQRAVVTAQAAQSLGLPPCTVGATYAFEPLPTDVEVSRRGRLFVTLLPGGPESAALGARGKLVKVWPRSGRSVSIASGFRGAANLALGVHHRIYVAELFADRVSLVRVRHNVGVLEPDTIEAPAPAALENRGDYLYIGYDVLNPDGGSLSAIFRPSAIGR